MKAVVSAADRRCACFILFIGNITKANFQDWQFYTFRRIFVFLLKISAISTHWTMAFGQSDFFYAKA